MQNINYSELVIQIGLLAGSITATFTLMVFIYNKLVSEPNKALSEVIQKEYNTKLNESIIPLINSLDRLTELLNDSKSDRAVLHAKDSSQDDRMGRQDERMNRHDNRITSLETWKDTHCEFHK